MFSAMRSIFSDDATNIWQTTSYEGHTAIDIHARYFTVRKDAPKEPNLPFSQGVDPEGTLLKLRKHDLIHGRDNKVEYMKMTKIEGRVQ